MARPSVAEEEEENEDDREVSICVHVCENPYNPNPARQKTNRQVAECALYIARDKKRCKRKKERKMTEKRDNRYECCCCIWMFIFFFCVRGLAKSCPDVKLQCKRWQLCCVVHC